MPDETRYKILMVAAEAVPFAKEGGVADVIGSLPKELAALGHEVCVFIPRYGSIDLARWDIQPTGVNLAVYIGGIAWNISILRATLPDSVVTVYLLDNNEFFGWHQRIYFGLERHDEQLRFLLFCRGLLEALPHLGFSPDIIHLNDWQTAPCAAYLRTTYRHLLREGRTRVVYTIHNLQYQGCWGPSILDEAELDRGYFFHPGGLEYWGEVNWMKAGIVYSDVVTTVSHRYAEEIQTSAFGWGLEGTLAQRRDRLFGIPNGLDWDVWNPATDSALPVKYTQANAVKAKKRNRTAFRKDYGLQNDANVPLVGIVSRLVEQKGFDLVAAVVSELGNLPLQLFVLGSGAWYYENLFRDLPGYMGNVRSYIGFDNALSRRIYAASDFFLMPSAFEPGGLGQLIALRYGSLPIVHVTGGLADTVTDLYADPERGNGISFIHYDTYALLNALHRAIELYADRERWPGLVARAMAYDSRWSASADAYSHAYQQAFSYSPM